MTEQEREELIEKIARREELIEAMTRSMWYVEPENNTLMLNDLARAALAVAGPVIREQADNALREENARLREALKPFAYYAEQIPDDVSDTASASGTVGDLRAAAAAIREGGKDE